MDFEAIWNGHKTFIIRVGVGALVFLVLSAYTSSVRGEAERLRRDNAGIQSGLSAKIDQLRQAEALELGRSEALEERLEPEVFDAMAWSAPEAYTLPADESEPALYYLRAVTRQAVPAVERAYDEALQRAPSEPLRAPRTAQALGLPTEIDDDEVANGLARASVYSGVVVILLEEGARVISEVSGGEVRYEALEGLGGFVRLTPVRVAFEGDAELLARVLARLQTPGRFLEVLDCRVERAGDRPDDAIEITLEGRALARVDALPANEKAESDGGRGTRRPRRLRRFGRER